MLAERFQRSLSVGSVAQREQLIQQIENIRTGAEPLERIGNFALRMPFSNLSWGEADILAVGLTEGAVKGLGFSIESGPERKYDSSYLWGPIDTWSYSICRGFPTAPPPSKAVVAANRTTHPTQ